MIKSIDLDEIAGNLCEMMPEILSNITGMSKFNREGGNTYMYDDGRCVYVSQGISPLLTPYHHDYVELMVLNSHEPRSHISFILHRTSKVELALLSDFLQLAYEYLNGMSFIYLPRIAEEIPPECLRTIKELGINPKIKSEIRLHKCSDQNGKKYIYKFIRRCVGCGYMNMPVHTDTDKFNNLYHATLALF